MSRSPYELINSFDESLWREGLSSLLIEHNEKALTAIISMLSDNAWHKREAAAKTLSEWGPELSATLIARLNENNFDEFYWLLFVIGSFNNDNSRTTIRRYLAHNSSEIRSYAVRAISRTKSIENARALYGMLNDRNWAIRKLAFEQLLGFDSLIIEDLRNIIKTPGSEVNHSVIALFVKLGKDQILPELTEIYKTANFQMRFSIISSLGELGTPTAIDFLINGLSDPSWAIRQKAAEQLTNLGSTVFDRLTAAFNKSDSLIKHQIFHILVELLGDKSLPLITRLLSTNNHEYRLLAIENLAKLKSDEATSSLLTCLSDPNRIISDFASDCLAKKPNLNLELLLNRLFTEDENLRFQIIKIIGTIGGLALNPIIKILEVGTKQERLFLLGVLQKITPNDQLINVLIKLLNDKSWPVRNAAANCLIGYGEASVSAIVTALNSSSDDVQYWSRKALLSIGPKAVDVLTNILAQGNDPILMPHIVAALLSMNHADAVPAVLKFLETNDDLRIQSVFEDIPEITSKDVINTILNLLTHPEERVAKWLAHLLKKVTNPGLRRTVFLGFSHSNEKVRFYVSSAINNWENMTDSDLKIIVRQMHVEKTRKNLYAIIQIVSKYPYSSVITGLEEFLNASDPALMLDLMKLVAKAEKPEFLEMLDRLLSSRSQAITLEDVDKVGDILGHVYHSKPEGLIQGLSAPSMAYRLCCIIALDSFHDRKVAFSIMDNLLQDEDKLVMQRAVKTLAKYFFHDDFRLKGAITDFFLQLGQIITEPLIEVIENLENEMDRKALIDMIESVGGEVNTDMLNIKGEKKVVLSDSHLDEVLERRRQAMDELEKYDELIKATHTKNLSIMFTDVKGYTAFSSKSSLSEVMSMLKQHDEILQPVFEKYGGDALKKIGDAFLVVFENHNNAILSAIEIQRQLRDFNAQVSEDRKLAIRIAINTGSVIRTENDVLGDPVNLASRLEGVGDAFEIVISENTYAQIDKNIFEFEDFGEHMLKGLEKPIKAYKVKW